MQTFRRLSEPAMLPVDNQDLADLIAVMFAMVEGAGSFQRAQQCGLFDGMGVDMQDQLQTLVPPSRGGTDTRAEAEWIWSQMKRLARKDGHVRRLMRDVRELPSAPIMQ